MNDLIKLNTDDSMKFLLTSGLLFEINRRVLHPFGLSLAVNVEDQEGMLSEEDSIVTLNSSLINYSDDEEGIFFDDEALFEGTAKFRNFLRDFGEMRLKTRASKLGYTIQPTPDVSNMINFKATPVSSTPIPVKEAPVSESVTMEINEQSDLSIDTNIDDLRRKNSAMRQGESISDKLREMVPGNHPPKILGEDDDKSPGARRAAKFHGISHKAPGTGKSCVSTKENTVYTSILGSSGIITCTDCGATLNDPDLNKD